MFQSSQEVVNWIDDQLKFGIKPGLERMEWIMEKLNHPERLLRTVHIGGANGKGSTTAFLRSILQRGGYEVGTFTSPYIESFNERISINGQSIADEDLVKAANIIKPLTEELQSTELGSPSEFEIITAIAVYYFAKIHPVDITLIEVGLGGRLDSTNIIHPFLSIITNVGYDHMNILGNTLTEIAREKAGIIKSGSPVITAGKDQEVLSIIEQTAKEKRTTVYQLGREFSYEDLGATETGESFSLSTVYKSFPELNISMFGKHQIENAALAVMAAQYLKQFYAFFVDDEFIIEGLKDTNWSGRFEIIKRNPLVILDGAHNREGIQSLTDTLKRHFPNKEIRILFTALADKPLKEMIQSLDQLNGSIYFTQFSHKRAAKAEELFSLSNTNKKEIVLDWQSFINEQLKQLDEQELFVICGSLYFIKDVKLYLSHI